MTTNQKQLRHLTDDESAFVTDGELVFKVPVKYASAIVKIEGLRHSFEDLGGRFISHEKQKD